MQKPFLVNPLPFFISVGREALSDLFLGMGVLLPSSKVLVGTVILEKPGRFLLPSLLHRPPLFFTRLLGAQQFA